MKITATDITSSDSAKPLPNGVYDGLAKDGTVLVKFGPHEYRGDLPVQINEGIEAYCTVTVDGESMTLVLDETLIADSGETPS